MLSAGVSPSDTAASVMATSDTDALAALKQMDSTAFDAQQSVDVMVQSTLAARLETTAWTMTRYQPAVVLDSVSSCDPVLDL